MKIVINGLSSYEGGAFTYLSQVITNLPPSPTLRVKVFVQPSCADEIPSNSQIDVVVATWAKNLFFRFLWERLYLSFFLRKWKADLLFCPGAIINCFVPRGCHTVVTFQNFLAFHPEERKKYPLFSSMRLRLFLLNRAMTRSMTRANLVICLTTYARDIITRLIPKIASRSIVIHHGLSDQFQTAEKNDIPCPKNISGPYLLYVSSFFDYKAQLEVVRAYASLRTLRETSERLVLIGRNRHPYFDKVRREILNLNLTQEIILMGDIPQSELLAYYKHAKINIFASRCENFPFILLEAMAAGRPVLASNVSPMPQIGGEAPLYFNPDKPEELTQLLKTVLDDPTLWGKLSSRSAKQASLFSWEKSGREIWSALESLDNLK